MLPGRDIAPDALLALSDLLSRPPGKLAARRRGQADRLGNGRERHPEDTVQSEHNLLGRAEPLQHAEQGEPDAIIEPHPVSWIGQ
jgi:hypothetical protein